MQLMATERDKMRASRLADLAKKEGQGRLRIVPNGFMRDIVERFNLRSMFETEEVRDKLKMAGFARAGGSSPTYSSDLPCRSSSP
jgi:tight adherence protein C